MKIGILTGGGDCPGINAVLRAVVRTAVNEYGWEVIGFRDGFRGLVLNEYCRLTPVDVAGILTRGGTILGSSNRDNLSFRRKKTAAKGPLVCAMRRAALPARDWRRWHPQLRLGFYRKRAAGDRDPQNH